MFQRYCTGKHPGHSNARLCSTGKFWYRDSKDTKTNDSSKYWSVVKSTEDTQIKTSMEAQSWLPIKAGKKCVSGCILSCCNSCSFCAYPRASTKARFKPRWVVERKKACQKCFLCLCLSVPSAANAHSVVTDRPVGGHLQKFWQVWQELGANPRVVSILKEGNILPFKRKPPLTRSPMIQSGYTYPTKNRFLKEALNSVKEKLVVETVVIRSSLAFYNRLFLVPIPNNK